MNAKNLLSNMTLEQLIEQWELISLQKVTQEVAMVRGWLLEALEEKAPEAMDNYYSDFYEDSDLRKIVLG